MLTFILSIFVLMGALHFLGIALWTFYQDNKKKTIEITLASPEFFTIGQNIQLGDGIYQILDIDHVGKAVCKRIRGKVKCK
jgi:hypothetical protein